MSRLQLGEWAPRTRMEWVLDLVTTTVGLVAVVLAVTLTPGWWLIAGFAGIRLGLRFRARLEGRRPGQWRPR